MDGVALKVGPGVKRQAEGARPAGMPDGASAAARKLALKGPDYPGSLWYIPG